MQERNADILEPGSDGEGDRMRKGQIGMCLEGGAQRVFLWQILSVVWHQERTHGGDENMCA